MVEREGIQTSYFIAKGAVQSNIEKPPLTTTTMQRYGEFFRFANKSSLFMEIKEKFGLLNFIRIFAL